LVTRCDIEYILQEYQSENKNNSWSNTMVNTTSFDKTKLDKLETESDKLNATVNITIELSNQVISYLGL
jgi:hypothetical protein